jgi:hypothetical protein
MNTASGVDTSCEEGVFKDKFDPLEYIRTYYPDVVDVEKLLVIMYLLHTNTEGNYIIDTISSRTETERELVENVAIFDFYREVVESLLPSFPRGDAHILDIGGGPTIYQHIAISLLGKHITHAEFLESNRKEVLSWLHQEERAHSWDSYFELVREYFKYGRMPEILMNLSLSEDLLSVERAIYVQNILKAPTVDDFKRHVRLCIGDDVVRGDIFRVDLGLLGESRTYDIVTSNFVAESAATNQEQWHAGMHNLLSRVRTGGYFIQTAIKNATWYQVGSERLPATAVDVDTINRKLEKGGYKILYQKVLEGSSSDVVGYDGMIFTFAQKIGNL